MSDSSDVQVPSFVFCLKRPETEAHRERLVAMAAWLDASKFSCTYSESGEFADLAVDPHDPKDWETAGLTAFQIYAAAHIIYRLSLELNDARPPRQMPRVRS